MALSRRVSPYSTTIVYTFISSLSDELTVSIGETLRVLAGYEVGWSLCIDCQGSRAWCRMSVKRKYNGAASRCNGDYKNSKSSARVSSLAQAVQAWSLIFLD